MMHILTLLSCVLAGRLAACHPGEEHAAELRARGEFLQGHVGNLDHCAQELESSGVDRRDIQRRLFMTNRLRRKRRLEDEQDSESWHALHASRESLFRSTASCVLAPEEMVGPYYVAGESVRSDITESQPGIPVEVDVQFIDATTCRPVVGKYVDLWQANATGVYGGVVNPENGNGLADQKNLKNTFLRGVQKTDDDGVVKFSTVFPGHYKGRTIHIHVMLHPNAKPYPDGTIIDHTAAYVGQMYFDQKLINSIERLAPYSQNRNPLTLNSQDLLLQQDLSLGGHPIVQYKMIGNRLEDGIVAWLRYGINPAKRSRVSPVATREGFLSRETLEVQKSEM
ncbi:Intradiol ring-cleavage dioxygenase, core [Metarhizium album ARSEF 1941]|uniref:Intradiol ring-cleavage dioxygenase, core n=1 Tax=Metarhizium album (strain ARSEF 1941) TaxID=1081103 RepID=A0A0B2WPI2_METAS|nr:Intradiol ring-cleavage dioxygenase, core [Metarhizium album ARSEF 1941]KHN94900.1 Intradiol ring-cleavage dioxygenase, core [Metarhizium album ARSEF 1941]